MGIFKKKKGEEGIVEIDEIYGYFDEVIKQRKEIEVKIKNKVYKCAAYSIYEKKKSIRIQDKGMDYLDKSSAVCGFSLDNTWFSFNSKFIILEDKPHLQLPDEIKHSERRRYKRVSFAARENASSSILESLGKGIGINGKLLNISVGGICVEIERTIILESEKEITPRENTLEEGKKLGLVRIKGISSVPEFDTNGRVIEMRRGHKWKIAVELPKLPNTIKEKIERFVDSRSRDFTLIRRSRKKRLENEKRLEKERQKNNEVEENNSIGFSKEVDSPSTDIQDKSEALKTATQGKDKKKLISVLILGQPLERDLFFLRKFNNFAINMAKTLQDFIRLLGEEKQELVFVPSFIENKKTIDILLKLSQKEILIHSRIFLFIEEMISENDVVKCKALDVQGIIKIPIKDPLVLIKKISKKKTE